MLKRMSAALAVAGAMAIGGSGVAIASHGADDPAGHEQHHHHKGKHHGRHHHHKGEDHHGQGNDDGPNHQ
jgi:Spy/CpxP family protein refolding chaperone